MARSVAPGRVSSASESPGHCMQVGLCCGHGGGNQKKGPVAERARGAQVGCGRRKKSNTA